MTKSRQEYLKRELYEIQRNHYYNHKDKIDLKPLLKVVNGNKDRLIEILTVMLAKYNCKIGGLCYKHDTELIKHLKKEKEIAIDKILLKL